jgi:hypothetical protein
MAACALGARWRESNICSLDVSIGGKFKKQHVHANARGSIIMEDNHSGFSAPANLLDLHGVPPVIASHMREGIARQAEEFREPPQASVASDASRANLDSSPVRGVGGPGVAPEGRPLGSQQCSKRTRTGIAHLQRKISSPLQTGRCQVQFYQGEHEDCMGLLVLAA